MKEKIYTISLTEALESKCECILCKIEEKITNDAIKYYTGSAMMEPDTRIETNRKGFCAHHYNMMLSKNAKLSVALVLQTRLGEVISLLENASGVKKSRFSKASRIDGVKALLNESLSGCAACTKIEKQMNNCYDNFVFLLNTESDFYNSFFDSNGLCLKHFMKILPFLNYGHLFENLLSFQLKKLNLQKSEIDRFVLKFDYRNSDMPWDYVQDAPLRVINTLRGKYST